MGIENFKTQVEQEEEKFNKAVAKPSALEKVMAEMAKPSALEKAMAEMAKPSALEKVMAEMAKPSALEKVMAEMAKPSALEKAMAEFAKASAVFLSEPRYLVELAEMALSFDSNSVSVASVEDELKHVASELNSASNKSDFNNVFHGGSETLRFIILSIFLHFFLPQFNSIAANLLTPKVESYLENNEKQDRQKIKEIKKIPLLLSDVDVSNLRFITGNNVRLRAAPSTKADIYDELALGQIVILLTKEKNWVEVVYEYENGDSITGWVSARYTEKFIKNT